MNINMLITHTQYNYIVSVINKRYCSLLMESFVADSSTIRHTRLVLTQIYIPTGTSNGAAGTQIAMNL